MQRTIEAKTDLETASIQYQSAQAAAQAKLVLAEADRKIIAAKNDSEVQVLKRNVEAYGSGDAYVRGLLYEKLGPRIQSILTRGLNGGLFGLPLVPVQNVNQGGK